MAGRLLYPIRAYKGSTAIVGFSLEPTGNDAGRILDGSSYFSLTVDTSAKLYTLTALDAWADVLTSSAVVVSSGAGTTVSSVKVSENAAGFYEFAFVTAVALTVGEDKLNGLVYFSNTEHKA